MLRDGSTEQTLHGQRCLALCCVLLNGIVVALRVETAHCQQVEHLLVHIFFGVDDRLYHLLGVGAECWKIEIEVNGRLQRGAGNVHQTVDAHIVACEGVAELKVG